MRAVSHQLLNISKRAREYSDPLDVVYGAEVVEKLAQVIGRDQIVSLFLNYLYTYLRWLEIACNVVFTLLKQEFFVQFGLSHQFEIYLCQQ